MTRFLFRDNSYARTAESVVSTIGEDGAVELEATIFYAASGGQPGDMGRLVTTAGDTVAVTNARHPDGDKSRIMHIPEPGAPAIKPGAKVHLEINWERRHRLMRMHTALHLLSVVFPFPVTGGQVGTDKGRLDFDMPDVPDNLEAIQDRLNAMVASDHPVSSEWISDAEMDAQPELVKTMKVKPPLGQGRVRLIRIGDVDLQPCGGTHVRSTGEIGPLQLGRLEKKGKANRRVNLHFAEN